MVTEVISILPAPANANLILRLAASALKTAERTKSLPVEACFLPARIVDAAFSPKAPLSEREVITAI